MGEVTKNDLRRVPPAGGDIEREIWQLAIELDKIREGYQLAEIYQVWGLKKFMGKEYMGIRRSTFLIDPRGNIAYIWSNVKVKAHAEAVLKKLEELQ